MTSKRRIAEITFPPAQLREIKDKMLSWASRFSICLFLDSNEYPDRYGKYECLVAAGMTTQEVPGVLGSFRELQAFNSRQQDWLFGHLSYELKNELEPRLHSSNPARHGWKPMQFFRPAVVVYIRREADRLVVESLTDDPQTVMAEILSQGNDRQEASFASGVTFQSRASKEAYLERVIALKEHIRNGDCYEITFCNEAFAEDVAVDPAAVYQTLNHLSPAPFSAFYRDGDSAMMCASPERFLQKRAEVVRAQPIKGTSRRGVNEEADEQCRASLLNSEKERAENVMIVDLVRNDLARSCRTGSVEVEELFGIYSFPQVHQMISTISGELKDGLSGIEAIRYAFPMGSMTGAPKHKVMQLIDRYEGVQRELFSGSVGYFSPDGDFDFNVVIRSLFYNAATRYLSYQTGGAITWGSDPEAEWEEIRLKASAMERVFSERLHS